jgi:tetratricopeptide (TPR) repeat protein
MKRRAIADAALDAWGDEDLERAEQLYREALAAPHDGGWEEPASVEADLTLSLAGVLAAAGRDDEAQVHYANAIEAMERIGSALLPVARYFRAEHLSGLGRHGEVLEVLGTLVPAVPGYPAAKALEAVALHELGLPGADVAAAEAIAHAKSPGQLEGIRERLGSLAGGAREGGAE